VIELLNLWCLFQSVIMQQSSVFYDDNTYVDSNVLDLLHKGEDVVLKEYAQHLKDTAKTVAVIVHEAKLIPTKNDPESIWVAISASWWRKYAEATHYMDAVNQEVRTLPTTFHELQPGYFLPVDDCEQLKLLNELEPPKPYEDPAKKIESGGYEDARKYQRKYLNESDDIHKFVNLPLIAYLILQGQNPDDIDKSKVDIDEHDLHSVVKVHGQRGIKENEGPDSLRLIIDYTRIMVHFSLQPNPDEKRNEWIEFSSDVRLNDAFVNVFKVFSIPEADWEKYRFTQVVRYGVTKEKKYVTLEYKYDTSKPHRMLWDTTIGMTHLLENDIYSPEVKLVMSQQQPTEAAAPLPLQPLLIPPK